MFNIDTNIELLIKKYLSNREEISIKEYSSNKYIVDNLFLKILPLDNTYRYPIYVNEIFQLSKFKKSYLLLPENPKIVQQGINYLLYSTPYIFNSKNLLKYYPDNLDNFLILSYKLANLLFSFHLLDFFHNDIKPSNFLFFNDNYYLIDFDLAQKKK